MEESAKERKGERDATQIGLEATRATTQDKLAGEVVDAEEYELEWSIH